MCTGVQYSVLTGLPVAHYSPLPTSEVRRTNMGKELTVRGLIIGIIITLVFTAANVYFGLKAGLTFSTSIPAAVISMAILRGFRNATIQENTSSKPLPPRLARFHRSFLFCRA